MTMPKYPITLKYNKQKFVNGNDGKQQPVVSSAVEDSSKDESLVPITSKTSLSSPSKIVKLHYNSKALSSVNTTESPVSSPVGGRSSNRRARNRTPSPPSDVATLPEMITTINPVPPAITPPSSAPAYTTLSTSVTVTKDSESQESTSSPPTILISPPETKKPKTKPTSKATNSGSTTGTSPYYVPQISYKEAIRSLASYSDKTNTINNKLLSKTLTEMEQQKVEQEWFENVQIVSDRLHLLKEVFKAVQSIKKRKISGKFDLSGALANENSTSNDPTLNNTPLITTPFGSDEEEANHSIGGGNSSQQEEDDSSSNSNTDSPVPLGKRVPKKTVQFRV